jgi:hypothetical protein
VNDNTCQQKENGMDPSTMNKANWITAGATVFYALLTLGLFFIGCKTASILKNQLSTMRLDQRAWVAPFETKPETINTNQTYFKVPQFNVEVQHLGPAETGGYPGCYEYILQASVFGRT